MLVAEVLSPSSGANDTGLKLGDYFRVPSTSDHLVVDSARRVVMHHRRTEDGGIATRIFSEGDLSLGIGLAVPVATVFGG